MDIGYVRSGQPVVEICLTNTAIKTVTGVGILGLQPPDTIFSVGGVTGTWYVEGMFTAVGYKLRHMLSPARGKGVLEWVLGSGGERGVDYLHGGSTCAQTYAYVRSVHHVPTTLLLCYACEKPFQFFHFGLIYAICDLFLQINCTDSFGQSRLCRCLGSLCTFCAF